MTSCDTKLYFNLVLMNSLVSNQVIKFLIIYEISLIRGWRHLIQELCEKEDERKLNTTEIRML